MKSFEERRKMFEKKAPEEQGKKNNNINIKKKISGSKLDFINKLNSKGENNQTQNLPNKSNTQEKPKILPNSEIITEENPNMIIYKYPKLKVPLTDVNNCKILLFFGDQKDMFINAFINIYSDITFEDKFRYKIESSNSTNTFKDYYIKARSFKYNIRIISFPNFIQNKNDFGKSETMLELLDMIENKIPKRINYIFITLDENKKLSNKEIEFFYLFINLFKKENLKDKIMVLFPSNKSNENGQDNIKIINKLFNYEKNDFFFEEKFDSYFSSLFNPDFYYINNNILYENKNAEDWNKLYEKIKKIAQKISLSKSEDIDSVQINFIKEILSTKKEKWRSLSELNEYSKQDNIILLNYLLNTNINKDLSMYILPLYNKIAKPIEELKIFTSKITFNKDSYLNGNLLFYSKINFNNLEKINGENCEFDENILKNVKNLYTSKLTSLNFHNNKISDITIFNKEAFSNLSNLNLSNNNISNINILCNYKCNNLKTLDLSYNKISDIKCFSNDDSSSFQNLENLYLSNNYIKKLNKINIKSIKTLILLDNELSEGINDFNNNYCFNTNKVILENNNDEIVFQYLNEKDSGSDIEFKYLVKENNKNNLLGNLSFKDIKYMTLKNFENIDFLYNESLKKLLQLHLEENMINDITILNKIKFINIQSIYLNENPIIKGYYSLHIFNSITAKSVTVCYNNDQYECKIEFKKPNIVLYYNFNDLDFLKDNLLIEANSINIPQEIFDDNPNYFSYDAMKNSFPIFKKLKLYKLNIDYDSNKNKYVCQCEYNHNMNLKYMLNDLSLFKDDIFNDTSEITICNSVIDDNIDLSRQRFPSLYKIKLENNRIESMKIFNDIEEINKINKEIIEYNKKGKNEKEEKKEIDQKQTIKYISYSNLYNEILNKEKKDNEKIPLIQVISNSNICNNNLLENLNDAIFDMDTISSKNNEIKLNYNQPFKFYMLINKNKLNEIKSFKTCHTIEINNIELSINDLNFLSNPTLFYLRKIYLNGNKITNLDFLDKISSEWLNKISIKNNLIDNNGFEYINNKKTCKSLDIKIKEDNNNFYVINFSYKKNYELDFDYLYDVHKNFEILKMINFGTLYELNLSNLNIKNIDFLSNRTLTYLKVLNLDSNMIEDISIFTNENLQFRLYNFSIKNNPVRKGINVLNNDFFKRSIYLELSVLKYEKEFKICLNYKYPFYDIEFYINNINDIINTLDFKNLFIKLNTNNIDEIKVIENAIKSSESMDNKKTIFDIILFILNLRKLKKYDELNIINDNKSTQFGKDNNIYINDNNKDLIEKAFKYLLDKSSNYKNIISMTSGYIFHYLEYNFSNANFYNLNSKHENIIMYFPFTQINNLILYDCDFDLGIFQRTKFYKLEKLDLSHSKVTDIKGLCGDIPFTDLKVLNLSNNKSISNLSELKNAKFTQLKELYLSNNNLGDLNAINFGEYKFNYLSILDLSHNNIEYLSPLKFYRNLKELNLEYNSINNEKELYFIADLNEYCLIKLFGNKASGRDLGIYKMIKFLENKY